MRFVSVFLFLILVGLPAISFAQSDLDTTAFDRSIRVQDDLFLHVNGAWLERTEIPSDKSDFGSFTKLADLSQERIKKLIENLSKQSNEDGSLAQKVGDFYRSFMNEAKVNELGVAPIVDDLKAVDALESKADVFEYFGSAQKMGVATPVGFFVMQDAKDSTRYLAQLVQSGTTLPDRDYYLKDDEKSKAARGALKQYIEKLFDLAMLDGGSEAAASILDLETQLAEIQWERTELRNAEKRYNLKTLAQLAELTPGLDWTAFLQSTGAKSIEDINLWTPSFFEGLEEVVNETPVATWKQYLKYKVIDAFAPFLSDDFAKANFELYEMQLAGVPEMKPRWKRGCRCWNRVRGVG